MLLQLIGEKRNTFAFFGDKLPAANSPIRGYRRTKVRELIRVAVKLIGRFFTLLRTLAFLNKNKQQILLNLIERFISIASSRNFVQRSSVRCAFVHLARQ